MMNDLTLIAILVIVLLVALLIVSRGFRSFVLRTFGIEAEVHGVKTQSEINVRHHSRAEKIKNTGGSLRANITDNSILEDYEQGSDNADTG
ncbi:hypothetical protein G4Y79_15230 [Phototrophicus methaneseepsis]|uniref:Uncharacterized protein n=1 Tax=Phototrophicus methaneseepsis TaxID=2710758 RepID=A0A7S8E654_9CHLR|nr:hypothetical protein [Phototrophicus methaneseepsis]QPC81055.1 hypothetical protein G4Y79_15230 [Phototrophicus methaneseepsis]